MFPTASSSSSSLHKILLYYYLWIPLLISSQAHNLIMLPTNPDVSRQYLSSPSCPALHPTLNYRPVIGILSHPGDGASGRLKNGTHVSYIAASYVKFVESSGARVIPNLYTDPLHVIFNKLELVNGVLFTSGWAKRGLYFEVVHEIFKRVLEKNDAGRFFPCYAICLGFELLTMIISKDNNILESFSASYQASTLHFVDNNVNGTVFQRFPPGLLRKLSTDCLVMQNHKYGISPKTFEGNRRLSSFFDVLTTSTDKDNKVYVSTAQAQRYPVTAFQWHPEPTCSRLTSILSGTVGGNSARRHRHPGTAVTSSLESRKNAFEWGYTMIPHSEDAVEVSQHVANFFISEARKSPNRPPAHDVLDNLIYNYKTTYCGTQGIP